VNAYFLIIYGTLDRTVGSVELDKQIDAAANKLRDCFAQLMLLNQQRRLVLPLFFHRSVAGRCVRV